MAIPIYGSNEWDDLIALLVTAAEEAAELETLAKAIPVATIADVAIPTVYAAVSDMTANVAKAEGEAVSAALAVLVLEVDAIADKVNAMLAGLKTATIVASS